MEFRIADTFTDSLAKLSDRQQKAVKTTAFDLQVNPANPGMRFHKLDKARDKGFCSIRVNKDIRLIVHKTDNSLLLCYVDHLSRRNAGEAPIKEPFATRAAGVAPFSGHTTARRRVLRDESPLRGAVDGAGRGIPTCHARPGRTGHVRGDEDTADPCGTAMAPVAWWETREAH